MVVVVHHHVYAVGLVPQLALQALKDAHVNGKCACGLGNDPEKGYGSGEELLKRLLVDMAVKCWILEHRCECEEVTPLTAYQRSVPYI